MIMGDKSQASASPKFYSYSNRQYSALLEQNEFPIRLWPIKEPPRPQ